MPDPLMPGATQIDARNDGGSMVGGSPRAVWHTTESDPGSTSAMDIARYLNEVGYQCHLVWHPITGEVVQIVSANRAGRALANPAGGVQTNRRGEVCIQIEVVGRATEPFTDGPLNGGEAILDWLRSWGLPDAWPAGEPLPYPESYGDNGQRDADTWLQRGGHYGHSQVPENAHGDPGAIDTTTLLSGGDEMPKYVSVGSYQEETLNPNEWLTLAYDREYSDHHDMHGDGYFPSVLHGPAYFAADAEVRLAGVVPGVQGQLRYVEVDAESHEVTQAYPVQEWLGSDGDTFVRYSVAASYIGAGHRLRVQVIQYGDTPVTISDRYVRINFWS